MLSLEDLGADPCHQAKSWQATRMFFLAEQAGFSRTFHSKNACAAYGESKQCDSLAFSLDNWHWTLKEEAACNASIIWQEAEGTLTADKLMPMQRPNILFDEDGNTP